MRPPSRVAVAGLAASLGLLVVTSAIGAGGAAAVAGAVLAGLLLWVIWRMGLPGRLPVAYPELRAALHPRAEPVTPAPLPPAEDPLARLEASLADLERYRATLLAQAEAGHAVEPEELALLDATIAEHVREIEAGRSESAGTSTPRRARSL